MVRIRHLNHTRVSYKKQGVFYLFSIEFKGFQANQLPTANNNRYYQEKERTQKPRICGVLLRQYHKAYKYVCLINNFGS